MDIVFRAIDYLLDISQLQNWPESINLIKSRSATPPSHWRLPAIINLAVGGESRHSIPTVAAIAAIHTSIILVDDLIDDDNHFDKMQFRKGDIANLAVALFGAGLKAILHSDIEEPKQHQIYANLHDMMISTAIGQQWDSHSTDLTECEYWRIIRQKSSPFFGTTFFVGAVAGGAQSYVAQTLEEIGQIYGEMIQIHDDLKDALCSPASNDWAALRPSLPILYSLLVDHPDRERFAQLRSSVKEPDNLKEAQTILFRCGAVSYCAQALIQRYQTAIKCVDKIALHNREPLIETLNILIAPVVHLFEKIGAPLPDLV